MPLRYVYHYRPDWRIGAALIFGEKKVRADAVTALRREMIAHKEWPGSLDEEGFGLLTLSQRQREFIQIARFGRAEERPLDSFDSTTREIWWVGSCTLVVEGLCGKQAAEAVASSLQ